MCFLVDLSFHYIFYIELFQMEEFRFRMGSILPKIPKNEIPQSRTEFAGLTDLLTYLANDYGKAKTDSKEN